MPARLASLRDSSWIFSLAPPPRAASRSCGGAPPSGRPRPIVSTATLEATSPACAPPIPSATTNSGARTIRASSFARRWRPVSLPEYCSATLSIRSVDLEREFAVADADTIPRVQGARGLEQLLVEVGAIGRAEVFDDDRVPLFVDARVARGRERILELDFGRVAAAEDQVAVEVVDHPGFVSG